MMMMMMIDLLRPPYNNNNNNNNNNNYYYYYYYYYYNYYQYNYYYYYYYYYLDHHYYYYKCLKCMVNSGKLLPIVQSHFLFADSCLNINKIILSLTMISLTHPNRVNYLDEKWKLYGNWMRNGKWMISRRLEKS